MSNLFLKIKIVAFFAVIILAGFGFAGTALAAYYTSGNWVSTNLLSSEGGTIDSIDSFVYNLSALPANATSTVQFSQNNTNWYNSSGVLDGSDTMATGNQTINLSGLSWSGANFYYKITFTSDGTDTPVLDDISVYFTTNQAPNTPTNVSPSAGQTGAGLNPDLVGSAFSDPEGNSHIDSQWQVDDDFDFSSPVWPRTAGAGETNTTINATNGTFANELDGQIQLNSGATYYWRVRYKDNGSNSYSNWSTRTYFTTYLQQKMLVTVSGPKQCKAGESIKLAAQVKDAEGKVVNDATTIIDIWKPDDAVLVSDGSMTYISGSDGLYSYNYTCPSTEGVYVFSSKATSGGNNGYGSDVFYVAPWIGNMASDVWGNASRTLTDYATSSIADAVWDETRSEHTASGSFGEALQNIVPSAADIAQAVWGYSTRSLTSFGTLVSDIWSNNSRTLTSGASIAQDIWDAATRKLTSRQISDSDYISGESTAEKPTEYNIELVRKATFDFAGIADSGSTTTLADAELTQPDDHWNNYELWIMSGNNIGLKRAICDFDKASHTITLCGDPLSQVITAGDQYVISHERKLVYAIWNWTERQLTSAANIAGDIWGYSGGRTLSAFGDLAADVWNAAYAPTRRLTDETLTGGGSLATESYVAPIRNAWEGAVGTADSGSTTTLVDDSLTQTDDFWNGMSVIITAGTNAGEVREISDFDAALDTITVATAFTSAIDNTSEYLIRREYIGTPDDLSTNPTLFARIKDIKTKLNQLDTLETKLDTVDSVVDAIRASQRLDYTVELSDVGEVETTKTYRAKLSIWDYENNPANATSTPTITLYNAVRTEIASSSMTMLSTGVYEYTYTVPSDATCGLWESIVSVDLGGNSALTLNDYWEVEGSPAKVIINRMSDTTVPSISANVTISNEGNSGYEYQYEWCVVTSQDNQCGGGDDVAYASAAKYLAVGEDYTANLSATVLNTGDYWFKVVVYYGIEASGASRTFTATEEEEEVAPGGAGAVAPTASLANIYSKLLEVQNELGYQGTGRTLYKDLSNTRYSLSALPDQLSEPLYAVLSGISSDIQTISGTKAYSLNDIYEVLEANSTDLSYIVNKSAELRAMAEVNKSLIGQAVNKPIIQTWWTEGSIILNIMAINPPDAARTVTVKEYLPKEIRAEHIIEMEEGLRLEYDSNLDSYFVTTEVKLGAGERKIFKIRAEDVFTIPEEELTALQEQSQTLMEPLKGTSYFAQASILKSEIDANLQSIARTQIEGTANIEKRISIYRNNQKDLQKVKDNIEALKIIVFEASGKAGVFGSLFGVSATMTWAIIIIVIVGIAVLMTLLFTLLARSRALEYHISGGKRLKAPPIVDLKKQAVKIKGGLTTYFLPPFGKPVVDLRQLIKILIIIGVLIILVLLGMRYLLSLFAKQNGGMEGSFSAAVAAPLAPIDLPQIKEALPSPNQIKILETETGWLRVRSSPSFEGEILTVVYFGEEYEYLNEKGGWYEIPLDMAYKSSRGPLETGWIFGEYVENEK